MIVDNCIQLEVLTWHYKRRAVDTGGDAEWTETHSSVKVVNGTFNVILGSVKPLDIAFDTQYWFGVAVDGGAELEPRIQLTESPYSLNSQSKDSITITPNDSSDAVASPILTQY